MKKWFYEYNNASFKDANIQRPKSVYSKWLKVYNEEQK